MTPEDAHDEIATAEAIRLAFKAGFTAVLERPSPENELTHSRWIFGGFGIANDLEPDAWSAWQQEGKH